MDHVFVMCKVSSMKLPTARIQEIAMLRTDDKGKQIDATLQNIIDDPDDKVYRSNIRGAMGEFADMLTGEFVYISYFGHDFYKPLLIRECDNACYRTVDLTGHAWVDLEQVAWPLFFDNTLKSRSIEDLARYLGITVTSDKLWLLRECYWVLMRRLTTGILFEAKARAGGGRLYEATQQFVRRF